MGTSLERARQFLARKAWDAAIADCTEAIRLDPLHVEAYFVRGVARRSKGCTAAAVADWTEAIRLEPQGAAARFERGSARLESMDFAGAIADLDATIRLDPRYPKAHCVRGSALALKAGNGGSHDDLAGAVRDLDEALRLDPNDALALHSRARIRATCSVAEFRDGPAALTDAFRACELSRWRNPAAIDTLAAAFAEVGDFARAIEAQERTIALYPVEALKVWGRKRLEQYRNRQPARDPEIRRTAPAAPPAAPAPLPQLTTPAAPLTPSAPEPQTITPMPVTPPTAEPIREPEPAIVAVPEKPAEDLPATPAAANAPSAPEPQTMVPLPVASPPEPTSWTTPRSTRWRISRLPVASPPEPTSWDAVVPSPAIDEPQTVAPLPVTSSPPGPIGEPEPAILAAPETAAEVLPDVPVNPTSTPAPKPQTVTSPPVASPIPEPIREPEPAVAGVPETPAEDLPTAPAAPLPPSAPGLQIITPLPVAPPTLESIREPAPALVAAPVAEVSPAAPVEVVPSSVNGVVPAPPVATVPSPPETPVQQQVPTFQEPPPPIRRRLPRAAPATNGQRLPASRPRVGRGPEEYVARGMAAMREGKFDAAVANFTEAIRLEPNDVRTYLFRSFAFGMRQECDAAVRDCTEAIRRDPTFAAAFRGRGSIRFAQNALADAIADFAESIRLEPELAEGHHLLAWLLATVPDGRFRDGPRALNHAEKACELSRYADGGHLGTLAAALAETGDFARAIRRQEEAIAHLEEGSGRTQAEHRLAHFRAGRPVRE